MTEEDTQAASPEDQPRPSGKDVPPSIHLKAFCCPHCGAYTHQFWYTLYVSQLDKDSLPFIPGDEDLKRLDEMPDVGREMREHWVRIVEEYRQGKLFIENTETCYSKSEVRNLHLSRCYTCDEIAVWVHDRLLFPHQRSGPSPNEDLPIDVKTDYEEARSILNNSPRGAAALLRLCVEKLTIFLKANGSNLDDRIGDLVKEGLDERVQRALDAVRVIGNESVHPGKMDLRDDRDTAETLFSLVNLIAEKMISEPKHVDAVYDSLPQSKREAIQRRDKETNQGS